MSETETLRLAPVDLECRVWRFLNEFNRESKRLLIDYPHKEFGDFDGVSIFSMIYFHVVTREDLTGSIACTTVSRLLGSRIARNAVLKRLRKFAEWGFLTTNTLEWRDRKDGKRVRESTRVTVHENFKLIFTDSFATDLRRNFIHLLLKQGSFRSLCGLEDSQHYQGFKMLVPYGKPETDFNKVGDLQTAEDLAQVVEIEASAVKDKKTENERWRRMKNDFVEGAVKIWLCASEANGFGKTLPNWGEPNVKGVASSERRELTQLFETYGGGVTGLACALFCNMRPELDPNTSRPVFNLTAPHRQFTTLDKKPSQFAKHFNSLLRDDEFEYYSLERWPKMREELKTFFYNLVRQEPREGHHKDKLGYALGDKHIRPDIR